MHDFFCLGLTALEVWCLAMIGLVFLAFLAFFWWQHFMPEKRAHHALQQLGPLTNNSSVACATRAA